MTSEVERKCWACKKPGMRPKGKAGISGLQTFQCPSCQAQFQWCAEPQMDGSFAEKHKSVGEAGYSMTSMMSDPDCTVFGDRQAPAGPATRSRRASPPPQPAAPRNPSQAELAERGIIFVEDENGVKTHRWHYGRAEWIKLEKRP